MQSAVQQNRSIGLSRSEITFLDLQQPQSFDIVLEPHASEPLNFRIIGSNPDNYIIKPQIGVIRPGQSATIRVYLKVYDSVSSFNYVDDKLFVVCISEAANLSQLTVKVKVEVKLKDLTHQENNYMTKLVKVQRYSIHEIDYQQFDLIMRQCNLLGNPRRIREFSKSLIIEFDQPVKLKPTIVIEGYSVFTISYLSTVTGRLNLFKVGQQVRVDSEVGGVQTLGSEIICKTPSELLVYQGLKNEPLKLHHSWHHTCKHEPNSYIVVEKSKTYMYQGWKRVHKAVHKQIKVNCITVYHEKMYISFQRIVTLGTTHVPAKLQQIAVANSLDSIPLDHTWIVCNNSQTITQMQCKKNLLLAYCTPTMYIYNVSNGQLLAKVEKELGHLLVIQGIFADNFLNLICVDSSSRLCKVNIELMDDYVGSQIVEMTQNCLKSVETSKGYVYILTHSRLLNFDLGQQRATEQLLHANEGEDFLDMAINSNDEIIVLKAKSQQKLIQIVKIV